MGNPFGDAFRFALGGADDSFAELAQKYGTAYHALDQDAASAVLVGIAPNQLQFNQAIDGPCDRRF